LGKPVTDQAGLGRIGMRRIDEDKMLVRLFRRLMPQQFKANQIAALRRNFGRDQIGLDLHDGCLGCRLVGRGHCTRRLSGCRCRRDGCVARSASCHLRRCRLLRRGCRRRQILALPGIPQHHAGEEEDQQQYQALIIHG